MLRRLMTFLRGSKSAGPGLCFDPKAEAAVDEVVAHVERGGSYMRIVPQDQERSREEADTLMEEGERCMAARQWNQAISAYNQVLQAFPNHFGAFMMRGNAHWELEKHAEAIADYHKAIDINPALFGAYMNLASVQRVAGHKEAAMQTYRRLLKKIPPGQASDVQVVKKAMQQLDEEFN